MLSLLVRYIRIVEARGSTPLCSITICPKTLSFRTFYIFAIRGLCAVPPRLRSSGRKVQYSPEEGIYPSSSSA